MNTYGREIGQKMKNRLKVIVDADAIIAQVNQNDRHHKNAMSISKSLSANGAQVIYPATAVAESNAFIQRALSSTATAYHTAKIFTDPSVEVIEVNQSILNEAMNYFSPKTSKKNTLFDCIIAATAKKYKADAIFSFDKFYKSKGFKLIEEIKF